MWITSLSRQYLVHTTFVSSANIYRAQFWFMHYYPLRTIFVPHVNIPCALHSMRRIMPKFSALPPRTSAPRVPLIKLLLDVNIQHACTAYQHCTCTNKFPIHSDNSQCTHHVHQYYAFAHRTCQYYA
jgi:hypothetical protein